MNAQCIVPNCLFITGIFCPLYNYSYLQNARGFLFYFYVCAFVYHKQPFLSKYDELWSTPSGSASVIRAPATMAGNFRYIPEAQKKLVVTMSLRGMEVKNIELTTGIHCHSIQRFIKSVEINW